MGYIETLAPRDWGICTLFSYPYTEGLRNLKIGFSCSEKGPSLIGRVTHILVGIALILPIINTITFIFLRLCSPQPHIFNESAVAYRDAPPISPVTILKVNPTLPERPPHPPQKEMEDKNRELKAKLALLTEQRNLLLVQLRKYDEDTQKKERTEVYQKIQELELEAATLMIKTDSKEVITHLRASTKLAESITKHDGVISSPPKDKKPLTIEMEGLSKTEITEVGGLSQVQPFNHLCGYYALFFMLQAVKEESFTDRETYAPLLKKWIRLIAIKRTSAYLSNHRVKSLPYRISISVKGLTRDEMQYLIENCEELALLRETTGCFLLDMNEFHENSEYAEPIKYLGKDKTDETPPKDFPLYAILQDDMHYYFAFAKKPEEGKPATFTFVHSLNYSVLNPNNFSSETFINMIKAIGGERTPLRIKW